MMRWLRLALLIATAAAVPSAAVAQTVACGCSITDGALGACLDDIRALPADPLIPNRVVNDIFRTSDGHDARTLTFGQYLRGLTTSLAGCIGVSSSMYSTDGCPGCICPSCTPTVCTAYQCTTDWDHTDATAHQYADHLDWKWWQVNRGTVASGWTAAVTDQVRDCPDINDVEHCSYNPAHGLIYDLGGEANKAVIFAVTDHTTDSCLEPFEWTVWLTDNPDATAVVRDGEPADPAKWNRAKLDQIFLQGWTRNPAAVGLPSDTHDLTDLSAGDAQSDSPTAVFSLPCGLTFRYASVVAGNFGSPGPHCEFNSSEDEVDAVAGLNADNTGLCADADGDGFRDHACGGNDCNDMDPNVHPGALETCSSPMDMNCDNVPSTCPSGTACYQGFCATNCLEGACADHFTCVQNNSANLCIPSVCASMTCPAGQVCGPSGCQDPCTGASCPVGQVCRGGACLDPCEGVACPVHQHCQVDAMGNGRCAADCSCTGCTAPATCSATTGRCETPDCAALDCTPPAQPDCTGSTPRCVGPCEGVTCPVGQECNAGTGQCERDGCFGVACPSGSHCNAGACVVDGAPDGGTMHDGGATGDGGHTTGDGGHTTGDGGHGGTDTGGCGCRTAGGMPSRGAPAALSLAALAAFAGLARRRRR